MNCRRSLPGKGYGPGVRDEIERIEAPDLSWKVVRDMAANRVTTEIGDGAHVGPFAFALFSLRDPLPFLADFSAAGRSLLPVLEGKAAVPEVPSGDDEFVELDEEGKPRYRFWTFPQIE